MRIENIEVFNIEGALRGMRSPLRSWDKSDTAINDGVLCVGDNDWKLLSTLTKSGTEHRKCLRQIFICCDIEAPEYWWKEYATYKVGTCENSTSTMHTIHKRDLTRDDFELDGYDGDYEVLDVTIEKINSMRKEFVEKTARGDEEEAKRIWKRIIVHIPPSYIYRRTCTLNYEVFLNMYRQRKHHKLCEWHTFLDNMIDGCPLLARLISVVG